MPPLNSGFSSFHRSNTFSETYAGLDGKLQKQVEKAVALLFADRRHPSLNAHQIHPDKYYWEAYVNRGDRLIYVPEGSHLLLVDIVAHDDIGRYGKRRKDK